MLRPTKSIAVLPFENLSRDPDNAYFADGIQDEILTELVKHRRFESDFAHFDTAIQSADVRNVRKIANQLGVATFLRVACRRAGNQVRVNVQLIDARTDSGSSGQRPTTGS